MAYKTKSSAMTMIEHLLENDSIKGASNIFAQDINRSNNTRSHVGNYAADLRNIKLATQAIKGFNGNSQIYTYLNKNNYKVHKALEMLWVLKYSIEYWQSYLERVKNGEKPSQGAYFTGYIEYLNGITCVTSDKILKRVIDDAASGKRVSESDEASKLNNASKAWIPFNEIVKSVRNLIGDRFLYDRAIDFNFVNSQPANEVINTAIGAVDEIYGKVLDYAPKDMPDVPPPVEPSGRSVVDPLTLSALPLLLHHLFSK
jgi:hypothetical protein